MPAHVLIVYLGPSEAADVNGVTFPRGTPVQVDADLAAALVSQGSFALSKSKPERAVKPTPETRGTRKRSD